MQCGSCWAFSATSNIESTTALNSGRAATSLSEQFLVDCDHNCGQYRFEDACDSGCQGGLMPNAFKYVISNGGQPSEASYPYNPPGGSCQSKPSVQKITGWEFVSQDEGQISAYVAATGPVSVAVDAAQWSFYNGGIMSSTSVCPDITTPPYNLDHGVNIVGYGVEGSTNYWIIRNSWSTTWGESGYGRILRGTGSASSPGFCGVNLFASNSKTSGTPPPTPPTPPPVPPPPSPPSGAFYQLQCTDSQCQSCNKYNFPQNQCLPDQSGGSAMITCGSGSITEKLWQNSDCTGSPTTTKRDPTNVCEQGQNGAYYENLCT